ncbi:uncharacterized protein A4U43_C01F29450 [Asparagus officinalis]|uniref:Uncharacterized protein n=1 Tax=Asparagus officinalis TaxID=4686 RepID=A0A5P1FTB7_ASPOF|nr:uncharacterized protein A4U43_C01F29450 [Asparagus officinalis]
MNQGDDERAKNGHNSYLEDDNEDRPQLLLCRAVDGVDDDVAQFDDNSSAVDGEDQSAVWVHYGEAVEAPEEAVEECGKDPNYRRLFP